MAKESLALSFVFCYIGNCVKKRAASTEQFDFEKRFGSGGGHGPLLGFVSRSLHLVFTFAG